MDKMSSGMSYRMYTFNCLLRRIYGAKWVFYYIQEMSRNFKK